MILKIIFWCLFQARTQRIAARAAIQKKAFQVFVVISPHMNSTNKHRSLTSVKWLSHYRFDSLLYFPHLIFFILLSFSCTPLPPSLHLLRYAVPTTRPTRLCRSSSSRCGTRWLTWRAVYCPRPCCSTGAGWAQRTFWYPSFKSRSSLCPSACLALHWRN